MKAPWSMMPLLPVTAAFTCGIIAEHSLSAGLSASAIAVAFAALFVAFKRPGLAITMLGFALGVACSVVHRPMPLPEDLNGIVTLWRGNVEAVKENNSGVSCVVDFTQAGTKAVNIKASLTIPSLSMCIEPGDEMVVSCALTPPDNDHDLPDETDYKAILTSKGITAIGLAVPDSVVSVTPARGIFNILQRARTSLTRRFYSSDVNDATAEFLQATLLGDTSQLDDNVRETFTQAGLAHVLALSGLHVGIIASMMSWMLLPLAMLGWHRWRALAVVGLLWAYAAVTGFSPSVTRAVVMATVFYIGVALGERRSSVNAMCLAFLIILVWSPASLYNAGFQMTFAASAGILASMKLLEWLPKKGAVITAVVTAVTVPLAATLTTGVVAMAHFHTFPVYFLLSNVAIGLLFTPLLIIGVVLLIFPEFSLLAACANALDALTLDVARFTASLPGAVVTDIYLDWPQMVLYFGALAAVSLWLFYRRRVYLHAAVVTLAGLIAVVALSGKTYARDEVYFLHHKRHTDIAVRQNDTLWIVTTAKPHEGEAKVQEYGRRFKDYMGRRGIQRIDIAPATLTTPLLQLSDDVMMVAGKRYLIIDDTQHVDTSGRADYILLTERFRGQIDKLPDCDSVILSNAVNRKRAARYLSELEARGQGVIDLRRRHITASAHGSHE